MNLRQEQKDTLQTIEIIQDLTFGSVLLIFGLGILIGGTIVFIMVLPPVLSATIVSIFFLLVCTIPIIGNGVIAIINTCLQIRDKKNTDQQCCMKLQLSLISDDNIIQFPTENDKK